MQRETVVAPPVLDADTRRAFKVRVLTALDAGSDVEVDLGATLNVDSSGLGALVMLDRRARTHGRQLVLRGACGQLLHYLEWTRLSEHFAMEP